MIELELRSHGQAIRQFRFDQDVVLIGRDPKNDIAFEDRNASRQHARIARGLEGYELEDLRSRNGTRINERVTQKSRLELEDQIRIGSHTLVVVAVGKKGEESSSSFSFEDVLDQTRAAVLADVGSEAPDSNFVLAVERDGEPGFKHLLGKGVTRLGRDPGCDLVLADDDVSRNHARVVWKRGRYYIEDLDSLNGTLIDGEPVYTSKLQLGEEVRIGPYRIRLQAAVESAPPKPAILNFECGSCHRAADKLWTACPFCGESERKPTRTSVVLEPLRAPDPAISLLDSTVQLRLSDETMASFRQLWVSFEEPDGDLHPVGQVPEEVRGCARCLFIPGRGASLLICPNCAAARIGKLNLRGVLQDWLTQGPVSVTLARITPRLEASALVQVSFSAPATGSRSGGLGDLWR